MNTFVFPHIQQLKMKSSILFLFASGFAFITFGQDAEKKCPPNMIEFCTNPCHPIPTCQNRNPKPPSFSCGGLCIPKCECDINSGYIRNEETKECVLISDCPCPKNSSTGCAPCCPDPTCQDRKPCCPSDKVCTEECRFTCRCDKGFIKDNSTGLCVTPKQCPK